MNDVLWRTVDVRPTTQTIKSNDLHGELQARLNQLGFRGAGLDDDGDGWTARHLPEGDSDASKRRLLAQLQQLDVEADRTDYQELTALFENFLTMPQRAPQEEGRRGA
ncbi:hypothetical protein JKP88DRAFT_276867 [Tribonema minus]|uniref:Uncharacterized protein n=1 Tax=Tribonema minus TaxID=303371 RepID=A0A835Z4L9_9STRA|nr:hypothetical protein JKP88DRAFT_276867 [Tribonema minus]